MVAILITVGILTLLIYHARLIYKSNKNKKEESFDDWGDRQI